MQQETSMQIVIMQETSMPISWYAVRIQYAVTNQYYEHVIIKKKLTN